MVNLVVIRPDGREEEYEYFAESISVGRDETCQVRLLDSMVSRVHCIITLDGKRYIVKDLDSRNGTWVNGRKISGRKHVREGDVIQIGPFRLMIRTETQDSTVIGERARTTEDAFEEDFGPQRQTEKVVQPLGMISNYLSETSGDQKRTPTRLRRERLHRNLLCLYRITEDLVVSTKDVDEILEYIMDEIFDIFSPSQATILLRDNEDEFPVPRKQRAAAGEEAIRPISHTVVNRILSDRVAVLTDDAQEDPRFKMGQSVILDQIRSVMAAPIWEGTNMLGVLYVDSVQIAGGFQREDVDLLTALGHQVALAIQRRRLIDRIKEEAVRNAVIRQNLGRFHSPQVVDLIMKGAADLEVKETTATIFFCDIVGFTALCSESSPLQLQQTLNLFCKIINQIVFTEEGTLDKFIGDAALAIFGAPLHQDDAPVRAVRTALLVREEFAKSLTPDLHFRVRYGINTGQAIVGNFGSDERMEYTILGHTVNLASRICDTAQPDHIVIGPDTYGAIEGKGLFDIEKLPPVRLKGVAQKVELYEVKGFL